MSLRRDIADSVLRLKCPHFGTTRSTIPRQPGDSSPTTRHLPSMYRRLTPRPTLSGAQALSMLRRSTFPLSRLCNRHACRLWSRMADVSPVLPRRQGGPDCHQLWKYKRFCRRQSRRQPASLLLHVAWPGVTVSTHHSGARQAMPRPPPLPLLFVHLRRSRASSPPHRARAARPRSRSPTTSRG